MHDFFCTKADDMNYNVLAEKVRYFKENEEGVRHMCKVLEDMREETEKNTMVQAIKNIMDSFGVSLEKAMESLKIPSDQRSMYAGMVSKK